MNIISDEKISQIKDLLLEMEDIANTDPAPMRIEVGDYDAATEIMRILNHLGNVIE